MNRVAIVNGKFHVGGRVTYTAVPEAEGRLMNVRMVNAVFEDANPKTCPSGFDPETNTADFIRHVGEYRASGVLAFTICLQGGFPGYEGAMNSAFAGDGSLKPGYLARVAKVIEPCADNGMAVILGLFYQRQSGILKDADAVRRGVVNVVRWVAEHGYENVLIEIANEYPHSGFKHEIIRSPLGMAELIRLARKTVPELLISASGYGDGRVHAQVAEASDFILLHGNGIDPAAMAANAREFLSYGKPVVYNEDDKHGDAAAEACKAVFEAGASWGFMDMPLNQCYPFHWAVEPRGDKVVYQTIKELTGGRYPAHRRP